MTTYDLLVAGGGPAGLATAITAAQAGLGVLVVEPREGPIDKACGEGLMPGAVRGLSDLGVVVDGRPFAGIRYLDGRHVAEARFAGRPGLGVRRTTLHAALTHRAAELGVVVTEGRVGDVRQNGGRVEIDVTGTAPSTVSAPYLVAADGLHSSIRAQLGLDVPAKRPSAGGRARYGIRRHLRVAPWTDLVEVHWARDHEIYVTPVADDLVGVAVLGPRGTAFDGAIEGVPALRERLGGAEAAGPDRGAGPLRQPVAGRVAGRVLLVGDAGGYVDALTGEGMRLAIEEAAAAVRCSLRGMPEAYEREWRDLTRRYRHGTEALLAAGRRPSIRGRIVPAAARFPGLFERCVDLVGGESRSSGTGTAREHRTLTPPTATP